MHTFRDYIKNSLLKMNIANDVQNNLAQKIKEFNRNTKLRNPNTTKEKSNVMNNAKTLLKGREMVYSGFRSGIFSLPN